MNNAFNFKLNKNIKYTRLVNSLLLNIISINFIITINSLPTNTLAADVTGLNLNLSSELKSNSYNNFLEYSFQDLTPSELSSLIILFENLIRKLDISDSHLPIISHAQQILYRKLSSQQNKANLVIQALPLEIRSIAKSNLSARNQFLKMSSLSPKPNYLPAWTIGEPESSKKLLSYFKKAEKNTGIEWEVLAAINLVETGFGRISGKSIANAQGPMQFLPSTWLEDGVGMGGDINSPHDSIQAAARYLVKRGGLNDIRKGLWGYNNSDYYGSAVLEYARLMKQDPNSFNGFYYWQIYYNSSLGDILLPEGYSQNKKIPISRYLKELPSSPPPHYSEKY
tara:strand:+ start:77 stop:1093 length:1017 start_codon:yes stop_codon:yes gene_type:complete